MKRCSTGRLVMVLNICVWSGKIDTHLLHRPWLNKWFEQANRLLLTFERSIRSEAKTVPTLLIAPSRSSNPTDQSLHEDLGYYADGAYTAATKSTTGDTAERNGEDTDPQEAYYACPLARFADLTRTLQDAPPADAIYPSVSSIAQALNSGSNSRWREILKTQPNMVLISLLSQDAVLQGLSLVETRLTTEKMDEKEYLGVWAWALLAKCRDAGQMRSEEICILRDLGKTAIRLLRGMKIGIPRAHDAEEQGADGESESDFDKPEQEMLQGAWLRTGGQGIEPLATSTLKDPIDDTAVDLFCDARVASELEAAKAQALASMASDPAPPAILKPERTNSVAAPSPPSSMGRKPSEGYTLQQAQDQAAKFESSLDMLVTIVGECYGQRDLLDGRTIWGEFDRD